MSGFDLGPYEALGLYDPASPHAAERRELLEWMAGLGIGPDDLKGVTPEDLLTVPGDRQLRGGDPVPEEELAAISGVSAERLREVRKAAGLGELPVQRDEAHAYRVFAEADLLFSDEEALHFVRVMGTALARVAEAALSLFLIDVESPMRSAGRTELERARASYTGSTLAGGLPTVITSLFVGHLRQAIARQRATGRVTDDYATAQLAVGFVDLTGFTTISASMSARELGTLVRRFEAAAFDVAADHDARVVKLIGDEVMLVAASPDALCRAAVALITRFEGEDHVTPRAGIAYGEVVTRGGDYYGREVNLASRIAQLAVPDEVLLSAEAASLVTSVPLEPAGRRQLKGFADPVPLFAVSSSPSPARA